MGTETGAGMIPKVGPVSALPCKDGWVFLMCIEDHQFHHLVQVMGNPEWTQDERFKDRFIRAANMDALRPLLTAWTMEHTKEEIFRLAQEAHVPLAPAYNVEEVVCSPQIQANVSSWSRPSRHRTGPLPRRALQTFGDAVADPAAGAPAGRT
jgi:crotonobetainyl-CoA:carnitine CoA-transferase CaiB-like acyl-CoA transferase